MKKLFLLLVILGMVATGCSKDEVDKGNDIPENIFFGLDKESVTISPDGGSVDVVVYSNYKWEISGTNDWCTPSVKKGDANEDGQIVTFSADMTYDDREATFWFRCADEKIKFVVSQKLKAVIIPNANNSFNIPAEGGVAVISYQTSVDCEVVIPEEAQDWITIAPATRGLVSESITLDTAENTTYSARTAVVKVVAKDNAELAVEYTINQVQNDAILADEDNTFTLPSEGGNIEIAYRTNVDCEVVIPEEAQDWITIVPATRGLVAQSATLHIAENRTYSARSAVIKVVAKNNAELVVEYTINQEQNDAFIADDNNVFTVPGPGGEVVIKYQTNVDCEIIIPKEAQDWITTIPETRGLVAYNITLNIAANNSGELRSCVIKVVSQEDNELFAEYTITQNPRYSLYYTSSDGNIVKPYSSSAFGATILSNTYKDGVGIIEFNAPITKIGDWTFYDCSSLTSVTIPDSVTTIGLGAFQECSNLTNVTIPDSVTSIEMQAFYHCSSLTSVAIPDSVTTIGDSAFYFCSSLTSVTIPDSATSIGNSAFLSCSSLTSVIIGDSVTTIEVSAFAGCSSLTIVTIPDSVTTIGDSAFYFCSSLTSVTIGDSVTSIGKSAFSCCSSLTSVTIPDSVPTIGNAAFAGCSSLREFNGKYASEDGRCLIIDGTLNSFAPAGLTEYTIPDSVTTIGERAFYSCTSLTSATIPDSVTEIERYAFYECSSLTSVTIGDSVTSIGKSAFSCCSSLTSVTIPDSVTTIGSGAFQECSSLREFNGKYASEDGRCLIIDGTLNSFAPAGLTEYTIPDSVTTIGGDAFFCCSSLTSVTIGDSVTTIGECAFCGCSSLTSITIPDSVTSIGWSAFYGCNRLTSVYCKATVPPTAYLGGFVYWDAFDDNASGRKIYVPMESVEAYKNADGWSVYAEDIVGYDF